MTKLSLTILFALSIAGCASNKSHLDQDQKGGVSLYGNWCGPDHPKDINASPPTIDPLDQICRTHDFCYVEKGFYDCDCDIAMKNDISKLVARTDITAEQRRFAHSFKLYFSNSLCEGDAKGKTKASRLLNNVYQTSKTGVNKVMSFFGVEEESSNKEIPSNKEKEVN